MKTQTYYKVVTTNLTSATPIANDLGLSTQYKVGEWVQPKVKQAPLMVLNSIHEARRFMRANTVYGPHRLFECEIKKSKRKWGWVSKFNAGALLKAIKWKKGYRQFVGSYKEFPTGTVFADEVMLVKEIF